MKLPLPQFKKIVQDTVLIALDLIVINSKNEVLLGKRKNSPAKGYLFVPGGRVLRGESLEQALSRISKSEIGVELRNKDATLQGIYEHVYKDNFFDDPGFGTHYVIIACKFSWDTNLLPNGDDQNETIEFLPIDIVRDHPTVHVFTKNYFINKPDNQFQFAETGH